MSNTNDDFAIDKCQLRQPTRQDYAALFDLLTEAFPMDKPIFDLLLSTERPFYRWTPYCLFHQDRPVGNAALFPIDVWLDGQVQSVLGFATVATREKFRRRGIARRLIEHLLALVEQQGQHAALFTRVPWLYEKFGFCDVPQTYLAMPSQQCDQLHSVCQVELAPRYNAELLPALRSLYETLPNLDGKVVRDELYWQYYDLLATAKPQWKFLLCRQKGIVVGYARVEQEKDRMNLSELCARNNDPAIVESLLHAGARLARDGGFGVLTITLIPGHIAWPILAGRRIDLEPEPPGANRERFMVRQTGTRPLGTLARVQWPFSDKF